MKWPLSDWFSTPRRKSPPPPRRRLRLEWLEGRAVPAVLHVTTLASDNAAQLGSLRNAVQTANANADAANTIVFDDSGNVFLMNGALHPTKPLTVLGRGFDQDSIVGGRDSIFRTSSALTLSGLTLGAAATSGNGGAVDETGGLLTVDRCAFVANSASGSGGGIFATGGLRLTNSLVRENASFGGFGGGVYSTGPTTITATTFYHNSGKSGGGGLLFFGGGDLTVTACTFSANTSPVGGAGIFTLCATGTTVTIANCTLNQNETPGIGGGLLASGPGTLRLANDTVAGNHGNGGGLFLSPALGTPSAILLNTIVANNIDATNQASDISGTVIAAFSLVRSTKGATFIGYTGSDLFGVDPHLGPLQNNGGPTQTMALLAGSPAIDTGYDGVTGPPYFLTTDQRGHLRKVGLHVDIGAFEYMPPPPPPPPPPRRGRIF